LTDYITHPEKILYKPYVVWSSYSKRLIFLGHMVPLKHTREKQPESIVSFDRPLAVIKKHNIQKKNKRGHRDVKILG
jgi:hypothetical protein